MTSWLGASALEGLAYPELATGPTVLGWEPLWIEPIFTRGQDWIITFAPSTTSNPWPGGTAITAYVYKANTDVSKPISTWVQEFAWDAVIDPVTGSVFFKAVYTDVDLVEDCALLRIVVVLPNAPASDTYIWAQGRVRRHD